MKRLLPFGLMGILAILIVAATSVAAPTSADPLDFDIAGGHFYKQTNGKGGTGDEGYSVTNAGGVPFWDVFQQLGGPPQAGYPTSRRFFWKGFLTQAMQKLVFQWRPEVGQVYFVNVFDEMSLAGYDPWLQAFRQTPPPFDTFPDTGLPWDQVVARHLAFLDSDPAIKDRYFAEPDWLNHFGLPVSYGDFGDVFVVRAQRAVLQRWKVNVPWARAGEVVIANGGDIAKEVGLFPADAMATELPPGVVPTPTATPAPPTPTPVPTPKPIPTPDPSHQPQAGTYEDCWWPHCNGTEIYVRLAGGAGASHGPFLNLALSQPFVGKKLRVMVLNVDPPVKGETRTYFELTLYRSLVGEVRPGDSLTEKKWETDVADLIPVKVWISGSSNEFSWPIEYGQYVLYFKGLYKWTFWEGKIIIVGGPPPDTVKYSLSFED